jgi:hypothetical protein
LGEEVEELAEQPAAFAASASDVECLEKPVQLLIITDQEGSSKLSLAEATSLAPVHFHLFISALNRLKPEKFKTYLVKNIGDSLMMRITCNPSELPNVLSLILQAQKDVANYRLKTGKLAIRVAIFLINEDIMAEGDHIALACNGDVAATLTTASDAVPEKRWGGASWLAGDLFGPSINLAFRGSHVSSSTLLIVEDAVAKLVWEQTRGSARKFSLRSFFAPLTHEQSAYFSESLPFSPLKGFEELFGKKNVEIGWDGHLFLRAVTFAREKEATRKLVLEQQKFRVWGRMLWAGDRPSNGEFREWKRRLHEMGGNTTYLRSIAAVKDERIIFPKRSRVDKSFQVGITFAFSSPSESAFSIFRERLEECQSSEEEGFLYALSTLAYAPTIEMGEGSKEFWPDSLKNAPWFVLLLTRWESQYRNYPSLHLQTRLQGAGIHDRGIDLRASAHGRTIGGEWDVYLCLTPTKNHKNPSRVFNTLCTKLSHTLWSRSPHKREIHSLTGILCHQSLDR